MKALTQEQRARRRVAIAQDVLKQIAALQLASTYCHADPNAELARLRTTPGDKKAQADTLTSHCRVCALGATFLSYIRLYDKVPIQDMVDVDGEVHPGYNLILATLRTYFSRQQLDMIEAHYEGFAVPKEDHYSRQFIATYFSPDIRLAAIMRNIIRNKGTFRLSAKDFTQKAVDVTDVYS